MALFNKIAQFISGTGTNIIDSLGTHVRGHNFNSVGICLIGKSGQFTEKQLNTAMDLLHDLEIQFDNEQIEVFQHSDLDRGKPFCAGLNMELFKEKYKMVKQSKSLQIK